jgi:hypothetical protein
MKRITKTMGWLVVAAALTMASAACSGSEDGMTAEPTPTPAGNTDAGNSDAQKKYTMTVTASKGGDAQTRALSYDSGTKGLSATWKAGEKVKVYTLNLNNYTFGDLLGELTALSDGASTTLSGEIDEPSAGTFLALVFPRYPVTYTGQKGTLDDIAANFDYATAYISNYTVTEGGTITYEEPVTFENQQAIVRFTLRDKDDNAIQATSLTISGLDAHLIQSLEGSTPTYGELTINPETPASEIWAALAIHYPSMSNPTMHISMTATTEDGETYTFSKEGVKFNPGEFYSITVKMERQPTHDLSKAKADVTLRDGDTATGTMTGHQLLIEDGATVTLSDASVTAPAGSGYGAICCLGDATIILADGTTNTAQSGDGNDYAAVSVPEGKTLTIRGGSAGTGKLVANAIVSGGTGGNARAGIGGKISASANGGNLIIEGGVIEATGSRDGAGIGSASDARFGEIEIKGGTVSAQGGEYGAGIGSGYHNSCGNISISGGNVTAQGGEYGAGIGSGNYSSCRNITISGGEVTATGGDRGAGIGSGYNQSSCDDITITGGRVSATGSMGGAGIGSGHYQSSCGEIRITGGADYIFAYKGSEVARCIGKGDGGSCGVVRIDDEVIEDYMFEEGSEEYFPTFTHFDLILDDGEDFKTSWTWTLQKKNNSN